MAKRKAPLRARATAWAVLTGSVWLGLSAELLACSNSSAGAAGAAGAATTHGGASSAGAGGGTAGVSNAGTAGAGNAATNGGTSAGGAQGGTSAGGASAAGAGGSSAGSAGAGGSSHTGVWKVMPLGDSITASTCYPQVLSQKFKDGGHSNFQFVGSQMSNQSCDGAPNVNMEGHGGYGVTFLPMGSTRACTKNSGCGSYAELQTWAAEKPDIVLMHFGTNDVWDGQEPAQILAAYLSVIDEFRKQNPNVIFFVSKIIKLNPTGCSSCLTGVAALVAALTDSWATSHSTATSPLYLLDDYNSGFDPDSATDTADHVHPLLPGATKMAIATYNGVTARGLF